MPQFEVYVSGPDARTSTQFASDIAGFLRRQCAEADISLKANEGHQDTGTTLQIVLAAPSIVVIAGGIAAWMKRQPKATLHIKPSGELEATHISSADAVRIAEIALKSDDTPTP